MKKALLSVFLLLILLSVAVVSFSRDGENQTWDTQCGPGEFRPLNACYAQYCQKCVDRTGREFEKCIEVLRPHVPCIVSDTVVEEREEEE